MPTDKLRGGFRYLTVFLTSPAGSTSTGLAELHGRAGHEPTRRRTRTTSPPTTICSTASGTRARTRCRWTAIDPNAGPGVAARRRAAGRTTASSVSGQQRADRRGEARPHGVAGRHGHLAAHRVRVDQRHRVVAQLADHDVPAPEHVDRRTGVRRAGVQLLRLRHVPHVDAGRHGVVLHVLGGQGVAGLDLEPVPARACRSSPRRSTATACSNVTGTSDWARGDQGGENIEANAILYRTLT